VVEIILDRIQQALWWNLFAQIWEFSVDTV
jgi:hypothetical protein